MCACISNQATVYCGCGVLLVCYSSLLMILVLTLMSTVIMLLIAEITTNLRYVLDVPFYVNA